MTLQTGFSNKCLSVGPQKCLPKSAPALSGQNSMSGQGRCPSPLVLGSEALGGRENPGWGHELQEKEGIGWAWGMGS